MPERAGIGVLATKVVLKRASRLIKGFSVVDFPEAMDLGFQSAQPLATNVHNYLMIK